MPLSIPLPEIDSTVYFHDHEGNVIFEADLIHLDTLCTEARNGLKVDSSEGRIKWINNVAVALSKLTGRAVAPAVAAFVIKRVYSEMFELKKTFENTPTSPNSMDSIQPDSTPSPDAVSSETSPDSPLSENYANEQLGALSQPNEPTISSTTPPAPKTKPRKRTRK